MSKLDDLLAVDSPSALNRLEQQDLFKHLKDVEANRKYTGEYQIACTDYYCKHCENTIRQYHGIGESFLDSVNSTLTITRFQDRRPFPKDEEVTCIRLQVHKHEVEYCSSCIETKLKSFQEKFPNKILLTLPWNKESRKV